MSAYGLYWCTNLFLVRFFVCLLDPQSSKLGASTTNTTTFSSSSTAKRSLDKINSGTPVKRTKSNVVGKQHKN